MKSTIVVVNLSIAYAIAVVGVSAFAALIFIRLQISNGNIVGEEEAIRLFLVFASFFYFLILKGMIIKVYMLRKKEGKGKAFIGHSLMVTLPLLFGWFVLAKVGVLVVITIVTFLFRYHYYVLLGRAGRAI